MALSEPFVVRARCRVGSEAPVVFEIPVSESRPSFAALLCKFAEMSGTPPPPPGYELAIREEYIGRKFVFGADSEMVIAPLSRVVPHIEPRPNESMVLVLQQPGDEHSGNRSFLRGGITLYADHDLGDLVYARSDCVSFEHEGAFICHGDPPLRSATRQISHLDEVDPVDL
jgi:hypothetical protein